MIKARIDERKKQKLDLAYTMDNRHYVLSRQIVQAPIYILERVKNETHAQRMQNYIESLLHEMIHSIIQIYTCLCADCGNKYKTDERKEGQGRTWQAIAHAVEKFCCNELGLDLDLHREGGLASEIHAGNTEISKTYDLDCERVYEDVEELRGFIESEEDEDLPSGLDSNNDQEDNNIGHGKEGSDG